MSYDIDVFKRQLPVLRDFLFHYISFKELELFINDTKNQNNFITCTANAHYLQAINHWCMVFGSQTSNPTHWKNLITDPPNFIDPIIYKLGLSKDSWNEYWSEITTFRNKHSTHRELFFDQKVPFLTTAYNLAIEYDLFIRDFISPDYIEDPYLKDILDEYRTEIVSVLDVLRSNK